MIAKTSRPKPIAESRKPATSCPASDRPFVFGTSFNANTKSSTPIGTLTQKIHRQPAYSVSRPPASGPTAAAPAITAPHTPNAAARSSPWNREFTLDRVDGRIAAPPMPCTTRATISTPADPARPASTEPRTNSATPARNNVLRPLASPNLPAVSSRAAKTTEYRLVTHWAPARSRSRASMIAGMDTPTIVPSSTISARPHARTPSAAHLFGACTRAEPAAAGALCVLTAPRFSLILRKPMNQPRKAHQPKG